jgi:hypothetical protein
VDKCIWLIECGSESTEALTRVVVVVVGLLGSNVVHLVDGTTLRAALDGAVLGGGQPYDGVGVGGESSASEVTLLSERRDDDGVLHGSYI